MIRVVTAGEMRAMDERAMGEHGIPGTVLMTRAGEGVALALVQTFALEPGEGVCIFCGKGNNGGDGFIAARSLGEEGITVTVYLVDATPDDLGGDARWAYDQWDQGGHPTGVIRTEEDLDQAVLLMGDSKVLVDALLGTGAEGAPRHMTARVVEEIMATAVPVVAVDIPTGVDADTGAAHSPAIEAHLTVTFELPKVGHVLFPGRSHCGELEVIPIGIPHEAHGQGGPKIELMELLDFAVRLPSRWPTMHKGDRGRLLVVGGSLGLTGAVALASQAAVRAGAGLVTAGVPLSLVDIMEAKLTEVMCLPLPELQSRALKRDAFNSIALFQRGQLSALVLGPGMGRHLGTLDLVRKVIQELPIPTVLDADGLYAFEGQVDALRLRSTDVPLILTPHLGEFEALTGVSPEEAAGDRFRVAGTWARRLGVVLVLKGSPTVIAHPVEDRVAVTRVGSEVLATGGTGDVLTGFIAGFLAQGLSSWDAALAGVYAHGLCADTWVQQKGSLIGMRASDLVEVFPDAVGSVYQELSG